MQTHACNLITAARWQFRGSICQRDANWVCWWDRSMGFPSTLHLFCQLPGKVWAILLLSSRHLICQQDPPRMYKDAREFSLPAVCDIKGRHCCARDKIRHVKERQWQDSLCRQPCPQAWYWGCTKVDLCWWKAPYKQAHRGSTQNEVFGANISMSPFQVDT